jgi:hypothetical protein
VNSSVSLRVFDAAGLEVFYALLAPSDHLLATVELSARTWDPASGPLTLRDGNWSWDWDGRDAAGRPLRAGPYRLEIASVQGGSQAKASKDLLILASSLPLNALWAAPNPVTKGVQGIRIGWKPGVPAELRVYDSTGSLVRSWEDALPPQVWDLQGASGAQVAGGIYLVAVRAKGQQKAAVFKMAVAR